MRGRLAPHTHSMLAWQESSLCGRGSSHVMKFHFSKQHVKNFSVSGREGGEELVLCEQGGGLQRKYN